MTVCYLYIWHQRIVLKTERQDLKTEKFLYVEEKNTNYEDGILL